jgi:hypothetical protein
LRAHHAAGLKARVPLHKAWFDGPCVVERAAFHAYDDDEHNDDRGLRPSDYVPVSATFTS